VRQADVVTTHDEQHAEVGRGVLSRASALVYWVLVLEGLVLLTSLPGIVVLLLLDRSTGSLPLVVLCAIPFGPAASGAVFAWRDWRDAPRDRDLSPARHFWRGYRLNLADVLRWWVPTTAVLAVLSVNVAHAGTLDGAARAGGVVSLVIAVALLAWAGLALVLTSLFAFRTRDVVRLAAYYLAARAGAALRVLSLVVLAGGLAYLTSEWLTWALASLLCLWLVVSTTSVVTDARTRFTA